MAENNSHPLMGSSWANFSALKRLYGKPRGNAAISAGILGRMPFTWIEKAYVAAKTGKVEAAPPVFILGHWRSGTTHLYNILSQAPRFQYVDPYQAGLPWDFLVMKKLFGPLLRRQLPKGRFIDGVPVTPTSPQEDEFALANMTPYSFLHALYFPSDFFETFNKGLFFEGLKGPEIKDWQDNLTYFYRKLQIAGPGKTILIKNPVYTARVKLLLDTFPEARFIHIRRNPYKIFFSMRNFYQQLLAELSLQPYDLPELDDHILSVFVRMMEDFERDKKAIPEGHLVELGFETLQKDPIKAISGIYRSLGLKGFEEDKAFYQTYLSAIKGYRKNVYAFAENDLKKVETHWRKFIRMGGYKRP